MRALAVAAVLAAAAAAPIPVLLDTDIATDFDDTMALFYLLSRPDIYDIRHIQVSTFNTTVRAQVAANILRAVGRFDIPIGIGTYTGEQRYPQYAFAEAYTVADFVADGGNVTYGVGRMAELMAAATPAAPLFIIEIAPATSLGEVLAANPALAANCVVVAMSGSVHAGYRNSSVISAEYNVHEDIPASQYAYNATWTTPLTTAPLDTTVFMQWGGPVYQQLVAANNSAHVHAQALLANYAAWYAGGGNTYGALLPFSPSTGTSTMYDAQAAWMTQYVAAGLGLGPHAATAAAAGGLPAVPWTALQQLPLVVNATGFTVPAAGVGRPVAAATGFTTRNPYDAVDAIGGEILGSIVAAE